ncbi:hypothetical protein SKP52_02780 [Sphingopyxis fribergensis]|uniref:Uncharacterized protein n=1 Tax=Sphingopyxis fribergensis TaxID=1515612 RepID=A0A0A7PBL1_9SPHN|nr:hypothetical protein [Sphingopyxis fribergensis]AJA07486.1 hypothetical protein SKP52_02780 [Sphingopyxis fribergensis]
MTTERVYHEIAELDDPDGPPWAVVAIYPDRPNGNGCVGIVKSLHTVHADAQLAVDAYRSGIQ